MVVEFLVLLRCQFASLNLKGHHVKITQTEDSFLIFLSSCTVELPDMNPVNDFVPLVITALEFPYRGANAPRTCVSGRQATYPDRRRLVPHSFSEQDPPRS